MMGRSVRVACNGNRTQSHWSEKRLLTEQVEFVASVDIQASRRSVQTRKTVCKLGGAVVRSCQRQSIWATECWAFVALGRNQRNLIQLWALGRRCLESSMRNHWSSIMFKPSLKIHTWIVVCDHGASSDWIRIIDWRNTIGAQSLVLENGIHLRLNATVTVRFHLQMDLLLNQVASVVEQGLVLVGLLLEKLLRQHFWVDTVVIF